MMGGGAPATDPHKVFAAEVDAHTSSLTHTHFDKYDKNADRVMTKEELAKLVHAQARRRSHPPPPPPPPHPTLPSRRRIPSAPPLHPHPPLTPDLGRVPKAPTLI